MTQPLAIKHVNVPYTIITAGVALSGVAISVISGVAISAAAIATAGIVVGVAIAVLGAGLCLFHLISCYLNRKQIAHIKGEFEKSKINDALNTKRMEVIYVTTHLLSGPILTSRVEDRVCFERPARVNQTSVTEIYSDGWKETHQVQIEGSSQVDLRFRIDGVNIHVEFIKNNECTYHVRDVEPTNEQNEYTRIFKERLQASQRDQDTLRNTLAHSLSQPGVVRCC